jgi:hypothetical protein
MYDADNLFPDENWGRDSTNYSVSKKCDTCSVQASIYDLEDIIGNLGFDNSNKLLDQKMMKIQRGKETKLFASRGTYHEYSREIREFQPNATMWKFHKYDAAGNELDEYDETQYIRNGFLATGAYPYAWGVSNEKDGFLGKEEAFLFKANAFNTKLTPYASQLANLMELNLENQVFNENEFLIFDYQLAFIGLESEDGDINSWDRGWYEDYNADNNATYSSNFDEGPVAIVHTIDDIKREQALEFFITFTDSQGVTMYWDNENKDWKSSATNTRIYTESAYEFKFAEIKKFYLSAPRNADGTIALFDNPVNQCFWVRMPATMGTLNIKIGINYTSATKYLLFRNLSCERKTALYKNINEVDLHRQDVVYSNTENDEVDMSETFYLYSKQLTAGRGQLYYQNSDNRLDELNYLTTEKEKPEWHYIRLATQMFSKAQIFNDVIKLEDVKIRYSDRFINGMNINFTDGLATITTLKTNMNINNPI